MTKSILFWTAIATAQFLAACGILLLCIDLNTLKALVF